MTVNCTPLVIQYIILSNKWGAVQWQTIFLDGYHCLGVQKHKRRFIRKSLRRCLDGGTGKESDTAVLLQAHPRPRRLRCR